MLNNIDLDKEEPEINFEEPENNEDTKIDENMNDIMKNPDENIKKIINNILNGLDISQDFEELSSKAIRVYNEVGFKRYNNGIDILKIIFLEAAKFSKFNINKRLNDFFDFLLSIINLDFNFICTALKIKVKNLDKNNKKDILFFWKEYITKQYLNIQGIKIKTQISKDILKLLLEHNYTVSQIYSILDVFKDIINYNENNDSINKFIQYEIIKSVINTIICYPKVNLDVLIIFLKSRISINKNKKNFGFDPKIALDFYLKASNDENNKDNNLHDLTIQEIFNQLKIMNPDISDIEISKMENQLKIVNFIINNPDYQNYNKKDFQDWTKNNFPKLKFDPQESDKNIAITVGMISLVLKKERGYYLRNTQIIAVLKFIGKDEKKGLIEEISTGEGKSCIICSLSIYFALRKHKVDIISSADTLVKRDSDEFKNIYDYFNLTTAYPHNSEPGPYTCDILYGTFLEFEGDYLREITSNRNIRKSRPYDVIIIDEVDNLFIDNILGSTRLTNTTKGFKFLTPIYLSTYISFELYDFFFLIFFKMSLKSLNKEKKEKFQLLINNPEERKKEIIKSLEEIYDTILNENKQKEIMKNLSKEEKIIIEKEIKKQGEIIEKMNFFKNFEKNLEYPDFLEPFVKSQYPYWIDNAYDAKNLMRHEIDYVISNDGGKKDIAPVDRTNTGEIELSTVYDNGLHQMLEIKHLLRLRNETLVHTFLSHITFFQKYWHKNQFLFFGLTGTIGDELTQKIYYHRFNSKILFIPQYRQKRFVELPPKLCKIEDHINEICKDIIINYHKGRKILVICRSINEAKFIEEKLIKFKTETLVNEISTNKDKNINDYKNEIVLYTRNDNNEKYNIKEKKKIFLSTNLGGRGTDLQTTQEEEKNGGLHVIITDMPSNLRVLKQAFGRTSREGKKGTGQMILKNTGYNSYSELLKEMNKKEINKINKVDNEIKVLLFKDKLFEDFCKQIQNIDPASYLYDDIEERWSYFLKTYVKIQGNNLDENKIRSEFEKFKYKINNVLKRDKVYEKFKNPFLKMNEGLRLYPNFEEELSNYFNINEKKTKFYFTQPYIQAIIKIANAKQYNEQFIKDVIGYFKETKKRIELFDKESLKPFLDSFKQWGEFLNIYKIQIEGFEEFSETIDRLLIDEPYENSELFKQYENILIIFKKIVERLESNIIFFEEFKKKGYLNDKKYKINIIIEELDDWLSKDKNKSLKKEIEYFYDASFKYVFKFSITRKIDSLETKFWILLCLGYILFIAGFILNSIVGGIITVAVIAGHSFFMRYAYKKYREVQIREDTIFAHLLKLIINTFKDKRDARGERLANIKYFNPSNNNSNIIHSIKNFILTEIFKYAENKFNKEIKNLNIIKFLLFVDNYMSEEIWLEKIKNIFILTFKDIYENTFNQRYSIFKNKITNNNYKEHLKNYNEIFDLFLNKCIIEISKLSNKRKYNEKKGLNCLEHLIMNLNSDQITEEIANQTVSYMIYFKLITSDGIINSKLFEDCFTKVENNNVVKKAQPFKINIISRFEKSISFLDISYLNQFIIKGFPIPMVDSSFIDLSNFYALNNYNVQEQLEKDYTLYIVNNFKSIINNMLLMNDSVFESYYKIFLNLIKSLIMDLLQERVFKAENHRSLENIVSTVLSNEEKEEFYRIIKEAQEKAIKIIKNE